MAKLIGWLIPQCLDKLSLQQNLIYYFVKTSRDMALSSVLLLYLINYGRMKLKSLWVPSTCFCELIKDFFSIGKQNISMYLNWAYVGILSLSRSWLFAYYNFFFFFPPLNVFNPLNSHKNWHFPFQMGAVQNKVQSKKKKASWDPHKQRTPNMLSLVFSLVHMVGWKTYLMSGN